MHTTTESWLRNVKALIDPTTFVGWDEAPATVKRSFAKKLARAVKTWPGDLLEHVVLGLRNLKTEGL